MEDSLTQIAQLGRRCGAEKVVLFGSRARGDHRERSDIDLAVFGMKRSEQNRFTEGLEALPTLLELDVVFVTDQTAPVLLENIRRDGVILMDRSKEKAAKLSDAVQRLREAISEYSRNPSDVVRDGVIQRFEFCTELAWKAAREYLLEQGYTEINSPKSAMKKAFADGLVDNEEAWISLLNDRNLTSHVYDDATAAEILGRIRSEYAPLFGKLIEKLKDF